MNRLGRKPLTKEKVKGKKRSLAPVTDLQTLKGKIKLIEKMMLKREKMEVEKRVKIKMIRNLAPQSDLEPQNQEAGEPSGLW